MNFKQLIADDDAVSPVIGVILMVAITVILAAVIGTFVLGQADQLNESAPSVTFDYEENADGTYDVIHAGGDDFENSNVKVEGTSGAFAPASGTTVSAGDQAASISEDGDGVIRIIWQSSESGTSSTIGELEV